MTAELTQRQRVGLEAFEGAQRAGVGLSDYAKAKGLAVRQVYDAVALLRRRGVLPPAEHRRKRKSNFVAVRVKSSPVERLEATPGSVRTALVCRLVHASGWRIECGEWPPAAWLAAVLSERGDATS